MGTSSELSGRLDIASPAPSVRIARVIARMNIGGPARLVVWLTEALSNDEFESTLICGTVATGEEDMSDLARTHGIEPVVFPEMSREITPRDVITFWKLYRFFRKYRPAFVETHTAKAGAVGRAAAFLYRWLTLGAMIGRPRPCRVVHFYHGHVLHGYYGKWKSGLFIAIEKVLARATDFIIVPSQQQLEELNVRFGIGRRERFRVVPYGLELDDFVGTSEHRRALRDRLNIADDEIVVGIVGRLTAIKNHDMFLRVARRIQDLGLRGIRFVVFGIGGERTLLEKHAQAMNLDNVLFAGFIGDAREIYAALDVIALTSRNEGMPLTLIEGMANGKAVVSTAVGGVVDLLGSVERRETIDVVQYEVRERGLTVASEDDAAFTVALMRLLNDAVLRQSIASSGRSHVLQEHHRKRFTDTIMNLYRERPA
jgi:glycosyltransferase involved in cell wall biosynthesis